VRNVQTHRGKGRTARTRTGREHAENSETVGLGWSVEKGNFLDDLEELAPRWFREKLGRTDDDWQRWINEPSVRPDARATIADYAKTAQFLADKGLTLTEAACDLFLDSVEKEFIAATRGCNVVKRRFYVRVLDIGAPPRTLNLCGGMGPGRAAEWALIEPRIPR
jgi:hypothetical protein